LCLRRCGAGGWLAGMPLRDKTIFVVEDDPDVLNSLRFLLETEGFKVRTFASGPALLSTSLPAPDDCLVIDYKMAEMDGFDLIVHLRDRQVSSPVVLVTAYPGHTVTARAQACGVRHIVFKPHIEESLIAHVQAAMREASAV
jgi:FixJ family two-component response regulator